MKPTNHGRVRNHNGFSTVIYAYNFSKNLLAALRSRPTPTSRRGQQSGQSQVGRSPLNLDGDIEDARSTRIVAAISSMFRSLASITLASVESCKNWSK